MPYEKPWTSFEEQLEILKKRGLSITDESKALGALKRIGYYRLSGYWYPFKKRSDSCCDLMNPINIKVQQQKLKKEKVEKIVLDAFLKGATFENAVKLYVFDKKLRLLVLDAVERIEIALRTDISHTLGELDRFAYLEANHLSNDFTQKIDNKTGVSSHMTWVQSHAKLINRSKDEFMKSYKTKYGLPVPIWIACEVWDFGTLSKLFSGLKPEHQIKIARKYGISDGAVFGSWLKSLNYLRNVCAYHSRLWNRNIVDQPKKPPEGDAPLFECAWQNGHTQARVFLLLYITQFLLTKINPSSSWWTRLVALIDKDFPNLDKLNIDLKSMGEIEGWRDWRW